MSDLKLFPIYIAVDTSSSMVASRIEAANEIVPAIIDACNQYSALAESLRFSLVTFDSKATTVIPMGSYEAATIPTLKAGGSTSYGAAFREIKSNIDKDIADLKTQGAKVLRPSVFLITDGEPNDQEADRQSAFAALTDTAWKPHPNVIMFGVGEAVATTLKKYVSHKGQAYITPTGVEAAEGLKSIIEFLIISFVTSVDVASAGGTEGIILPDPDDIEMELV